MKRVVLGITHLSRGTGAKTALALDCGHTAITMTMTDWIDVLLLLDASTVILCDCHECDRLQGTTNEMVEFL